MDSKSKNKKRFKGWFSKIIIILVVVANVIFTIKILDVFERTASEPAALIVAWFAFTTGELSILGMIKKNKVNASGFDMENVIETIIARLNDTNTMQEAKSDDNANNSNVQDVPM